MEKVCFDAPSGPAPGGPYSPAVGAGNLLFVSGQIPAKPDGSGIVHGTIQEEAHQVLQNLKLVLEDCGSSLEHVIKTTVFLANIDNFAAANEVYAEYFPTNRPARSTFQVGALPKAVQIEIEAIAIRPEA